MSSFTRALLRVLVAVTVLSGEADAADECGETCDANCTTCCQSWVIRATCSNGKGVALQGAYTSWREARDAAASTNARVKSCGGPGAGPCSDYHRCGAEVAVWTAWCSQEQTIVRPSESALAAKEFDAIGNVCDAQLAIIDDVMPKLAAFVSANRLTASAAKEASGLQSALPALKAQVAALRAKVTQMRDARKTTASGAKKFRTSQDRLLQDAVSSIDRARRLISDAASVDRTAEERARKKAMAEEAVQARREAAELAAAERRTQADAARTQELDKAHDQARAALEGAGKLIQEHSDQLSAFLARRNLTQSAASKGADLARKLSVLKDKTGVAQEALTAARAKTPMDAATVAVGVVRGRAQALLQEVNVVCGAARTLLDDKGSYSEDKVAPPPSDTSPSENTCEILFEAANGASGLTISLDGGSALKLPGKARVASGRHGIMVRKGKATEQRSELILCGRVTRVEIPEPK